METVEAIMGTYKVGNISEKKIFGREWQKLKGIRRHLEKSWLRSSVLVLEGMRSHVSTRKSWRKGYDTKSEVPAWLVDLSFSIKN